MIVQVALVVFALSAMLAVIVDAGLARLTQAQMQIAADAGAMEGLRMRNASATLEAAETERRAAARDVVQWVFDDDFGRSEAEDPYQYGAGPLIDLTGGVGALDAHPLMTVPAGRVYRPVLQFNESNEPYGDQIGGRFCYQESPWPSESSVYAEPGADVCGSPQTATGEYARNDFNPGVGNDAFLVRLRRSREFRDLTDQTDPGVATSGPPLPLLFGRGAAIHAGDGSASYSPRRDGLTVRATAIATALPAVRVGLPQTGVTPALPGVTPFVLDDWFTGLLDPVRYPAGCPAQVASDGSILGVTGGPAGCPLPGPTIGRFVGGLADASRATWLPASIIGRPRPAPRAAACASVTVINGYAPVTSRLASGVNRIIGFSPVQLRRVGACPPAGSAFSIRVVRGPSIVAPANATAVLYDGLPLPAGAAETERAELFDKHFARNGRPAYGALLVATLAR